jgi:hypothetical protein
VFLLKQKHAKAKTSLGGLLTASKTTREHTLIKLNIYQSKENLYQRKSLSKKRQR